MGRLERAEPPINLRGDRAEVHKQEVTGEATFPRHILEVGLGGGRSLLPKVISGRSPGFKVGVGRLVAMGELRRGDGECVM